MKALCNLETSKFLLIEDTEVSGSIYSIILERIIAERFPMHTILFWRSPGHEWMPGNYCPVLSLSPQYLPGVDRSITSITPDWLLKTIDQETKDWPSLEKLKCNADGDLDIHDLCSVTYKMTNAGQAAASYIIRTDPRAITSRTTKPSNAYAHLRNVCRSVDVIDCLTQRLDIEYIFLSESVYYSQAIIEAAIARGVRVPFILNREGPIIISKDHKRPPGHIGTSPRQLATREISMHHSTPSVDILQKDLNRRVYGLSTQNTATSSEIRAVDTLCRNLGRNFGFQYAQNAAELNSCLVHRRTIVLYLHANTDGMYHYGFSGYATPFDYFKDTCRKAISNPECCINVIVRPHPNLFWGSQSPYQSHRSMIEAESISLKANLGELASIMCNSGSNLVLSSSEIKLSDLFSIEGALHCSHHGTVLNDVYSYGLKTIASYVSPLYTVQDQRNCLFIRPDMSAESLRNFIDQPAEVVEDYHERIISSYKLIAYDKHFHTSYIRPLDKTPYSDKVHNLSKYIFESGLSWSYIKLVEYLPELSSFIDPIVFESVKVL